MSEAKSFRDLCPTEVNNLETAINSVKSLKEPYNQLSPAMEKCRAAMVEYAKLQPCISSAFLNQRCYQAITILIGLYVDPIIRSSLPSNSTLEAVNALCAFADAITNVRHIFPHWIPSASI